MRAWAVVAAAGLGHRLGEGGPKALRDLGGEPMLAHSLRAIASAGIEGVAIAAPPGEGDAVAAIARAAGGPSAVVVEGAGTRTASVRAALGAVPDSAQAVLVHDAARPLASAGLFARVLEALGRAEAAIPAIAVVDSLKRGSEGVVVASVEREGLWRAQTPQGFRAAVLRAAHERAAADGVEATDDAALVEGLGVAIAIVPGEERNIKVTTPLDVRLAEAFLREGASR